MSRGRTACCREGGVSQPEESPAKHHSFIKGRLMGLSRETALARVNFSPENYFSICIVLKKCTNGCLPC